MTIPSGSGAAAIQELDLDPETGRMPAASAAVVNRTTPYSPS